MSNIDTPSAAIGTAGHEAIKGALHVLLGALGPQDRKPVSPEALSGLHPVFLLTEHARSHDAGNVLTPYRGDALSIPCYAEHDGGVALLQTSFHKGDAYVEIVTFPDADPVHAHAVVALLSQVETR